MSSVRKSNEISIFAAFEVDATYLYNAKIFPSGGLEIYKIDQSDTDGLLDILAVKNTNMCRLLSNSKIMSYMPDVNTNVDPVQARTSVQTIMRLGEYHSPNFRDLFSQMSSGFPYSAEYKGHVMAIRQRVDGAIIFDSLLRLQGIDSSSYPPENMPSFEALVNQIWDNENIQPILRHALVKFAS
ncbi:hypothetical protein BKA69DRAFT_609000 [Paraphysoderma sedebokerense]|nr:hypothetical protein BKA69DRAFT_609000 [Paraphysoderma sedebokerense]